MSENKDENTCRILLIDDEIALLNALTAAIESEGLSCAKVTSADQALSILDINPTIELIVSDLNMPGIDGITLLQHVRERYKDRPWLQIIFVTAYATLENSVEALRLAATDFLYKPVRRDVLITSVRAALSKASEVKRDAEFREEGSIHLDRLGDEILALRSLLSPTGCIQIPSAEDISPSVETQRAKPTKERLLSFIQSNEVKNKLFKGEFVSDPVWNMLLDLMQQHLQDKEVSASSLYISSGTSISTASRRLGEMEEAGLVERRADKVDKRRQIVTITPKAYNLIEKYYQAVHQL